MKWFAILISLLVFNQDGSKWKLEKTKDDIKVYTRSVEGHEIREFQVQSNTHASLEQIDSLFRHVEDYVNWMPDLITAEVIKKNHNTYQYRMVIDAPFPVTNREVIAEMEFVYLENGLRIEHQGMPELIAPDEQYVRIPFFKGYWEFVENGTNVSINNQFLSNPGGSVPGWVANMFLVNNPYQTVKNLRSKLE